MSGRFLIPLFLVLLAASAADAQFGGGGLGGGMGGGGHRGGGRHKQPDPDPAPAPDPDANRPQSHMGSLSKVQITGVITRIDASGGRVTISYGEVDALNWPAGTMPFQVEKPDLIKGLSVGEKVRFHLESQQISAIAPIGPSGSPGTQ